jgi:hypothetical protein
MPSAKTSHKRQRPRQAKQPPTAPPHAAALQQLLDTLAEWEPRITRPQTKDDIDLAAHLWREYPRGVSIISIAERSLQDGGAGQVRVSGAAIVAKSRLDTLHKTAVELLARVAEGFRIPSTPLFVSAEIARRIYGPDCGDCFTVNPAKVSRCWPVCLGRDISHLERHERAIIRRSEPLLRRLLLKVADDDGTRLARFLPGLSRPTVPQPTFRPAKEVRDVFGFKTQKQLDCFLERHAEVKQMRPLTRGGTENQRRRMIDVLGMVRAISTDTAIMGDSRRRARMEARLKAAQLTQQLEAEALAMFKRPPA